MLAAVVADYLTLQSLLVITTGSSWQGGEIGGMVAWLVLLPWVSLPIQQSSAIVSCFFLQFQGKRHYVMDFWGGNSLLLGFDKLMNVQL